VRELTQHCLDLAALTSGFQIPLRYLGHAVGSGCVRPDQTSCRW